MLRVDDGTHLPEQIPDTQFAYPQWVSDGSGFFYIQLTGKAGTPERYQDNRARFHRLNTDPVQDPILMKRGLDPAIAIKPGQSPWITTHGTSPWVILSLVDIRQESARYVARLDDVMKGGAIWTPVASAQDEVVGAFVLGDDIYLQSTKDAPRGRLLKTSARAPQLGSAAVAAAQTELILEEAVPAKDGLYLRLLDGGVSRLQRVPTSGQRQDIALPFEGSIGALFASIGEDGVLMTLSGWLTPTAIYSASPDRRVADAAITPKAAIDTSAYETKRLFATAKDGVKIPYSVIYRKGLKLNGRNPCWMSAYGAYGFSPYAPNFASRTLALVDQGFIVGYANVRGGGEYGREWHRAGQLDKKPNTWRDLIAVCEDLCTRGWTRHSKLAIGGRSAGGITVGRAMTERPDLFAAVVGGVGWFNPLRYVVEPNGRAEEPEWGSIDDETGYRYLRAMDSYQSVKDGVAYPAVLLTTGATDPRVRPFHPAKMTARLQAATRSGKSVLLRVEFDAGHGFGSTREQQDSEAADTYAFLLQETAGN
jgi:prolyl oligopeptidase